MNVMGRTLLSYFSILQILHLSTKTGTKKAFLQCDSSKPFDSSRAISFLKAHSAVLLRMVPFVSLAGATVSFFKEGHLGLLIYLFFVLAFNWHGTVCQYKWECFMLEPTEMLSWIMIIFAASHNFGLSRCYPVVSKCRKADLPLY